MGTKIKDLKLHMQNVTVIARVVSKSQVSEIRMKKYAQTMVEDETDQIKLNLWRNQVSQVGEGDLIKIRNAFVHFRGREKQLSTWSNIEKVSHKDLSNSS